MATVDDIAHLLRRTEFVARPARIAELTPLTLDAAVDNVVDFTLNGNPAMDPYLTSADDSNRYGQYVYACNWWVQQMMTRPRPLQERMTLFWHGHFTSAWNAIDKGYQMMIQNQLFRQLGFGDFTALAQAVAIDPAMLVYLSNAQNVKGQPNQNFARELMELFTLGIGNYTEDDVAASARAWTGYNYNSTTGAYEYRSARHDATAGTFFGVTQSWTGPQIISAIVGLKGSIVAGFIARKLWESFAYVRPAQQIIDQLAMIFVASNFDIKSLVTAMLKRPEFYSTQAKQGLVRTPIEYIVNLSYLSGISAADLGIGYLLPAAGQGMFNPPNVAGWRPNGYWLSASALSGRSSLADGVAWRLAAGTAHDNLGTSGTNRVASANTAVDSATALFNLTNENGRGLGAVTRKAIVDWFVSEPSSYWRKRNVMYLTLLSPEMNMA